MSRSSPLDTKTGISIAQAETSRAMVRHWPSGIWALVGQISTDLFLPILAGALVALCFMAPPAGMLAWVALIPFAAAIKRAKGTAELYLGAYLGGLLFHLHALDLIRTRLGGCGVFESRTAEWLLHGCIAASVWPATLYLGRGFAKQVRLPMAIVLPIVWITGELMREELGWVVTWCPFPWLQLGATQASYSHVAQVADLGGVWAVVAVVAAVNGALFDAVAQRRLRPLGLGLVIFGAAWLYGDLRLRQTATVPGPSVALVPVSISPTAVSQHSAQADILLWSETAYRANDDESTPLNASELEACARSAGSTLIVGCLRKEADLRFNSAVVIDPREGYSGCYDKCFLVPWTEFTPWSWRRGTNNDSNLTHGTARPVFHIGDFTCAVSICYDACFARLYRSYSPKPDFFAACSRESSDVTGYAARAILDMTRLRAIENRRAFVRNVEGGFSGVVSSTGEFTPAPEQPWASPVGVGRIPIDRRNTLAGFAGNWLPYLCAGIVCLALILPRQRS